MTMGNHSRYRCILTALTFFAVLQSVQPCMALVVSEVMYHPHEDTGDVEFIELYNDRAVTEDMGGYALTNGVEYTFEPGTMIGPKQYLVVTKDPAALEAAYDIAGALGPYSGKLDNGGERIELSNANGRIIISFRYNDRAPWPVSPDGTGHSLILAKLGGDPEEGSTWSASTFIGGTPGAPDEIQVEPEDPSLVDIIALGHPGRYFKGTKEPSPGPGDQATTAWTEIGFNDDPATTSWINGPSGYGYSNESEELQHIKTQLNDMNGGYASVYARLAFTLTSEEINSFAQMRAEVNYDDGFVLYLNGERVGNSGSLPGDPPAFNQENSRAADYSAANVDLTARINLLVPGKNVLAIQGHNSDISGSSDCLVSPTLKATVAVPDTGDDPHARVVINELLANSDAAPGVDWIELYNPGPGAVDLSNVYLSDDRDELLQFKIPDGIVLQGGEFMAFREGTPPDGLSFALNFSGQTVYVTAATDEAIPQPVRLLDAVSYPVTPPDVTYGRFPDGAESFGLLESATFGSSNTQPLVNDIVINEIMYHHATREDQYEYVELHNQGGTTVALGGWAFTDGIEYEFAQGVSIAPGSYIVVAKDPALLATLYNNLTIGTNLFGPYTGGLDDHSERIRLSYPIQQIDLDTSQIETYMVTADEVTYYDGGRWPTWADGQGASMELRDPIANNNSPDAWADSDESSKTSWKQFEFSISGNDSKYRHDSVNVFDLLLLNRGEILIDDLECRIGSSNRLGNSGFENGESSWRILGNHVRSFVTTEDRHSGSHSLHMISTGHGDPGANRTNQSISGTTTSTVTFRGWARWLRGTRFLLLRTSREKSPVQPPRPAHSFELDIPLNLGTPGLQNTAYVPNRGPDILDVQHAPVLPAGGEPIVVTARITDNDGVGSVALNYRSEGDSTFAAIPMVDDGSGSDDIAGDSVFTAVIPGASGGTMRAFYLEASDGSASTRFPTMLDPSADVPNRTCMVRVGDALLTTEFATYRVWMSDAVINTFRSRPNLSNELMDCTFVYNNTEVFYSTRLRFRGSPFLRSGANRDPRGRYGYRIDFNPDQKFRSREEINLDNTEGGNRGPLQERASYWFYRKMGLQYSTQEYVRPILNGNAHSNYEDVYKIDGEYIDGWFPEDSNGYIHKIDDYFEYSADGTGFSNLDEGLKQDSSHPLLAETYRWGFEKRSHRENDTWDHIFDFATAMNTPSSSPTYEQAIESAVHPEHFARILALRHAVGDWDSYGYNRGKNNYFYYALPEGKWYLLPWDIDFTLGSGNGPTTNLFSMSSGKFPEVYQFVHYPKYERMYMQAFAELVSGPWQTSYGTNNPPTDFDIFLDDAADVLAANGGDAGRRNSIKAFVRDRRAYVLSQIPSLVFEITTNGGNDFCTSDSTVMIEGFAPFEVLGISANGTVVPAEFLGGGNAFKAYVPVDLGQNVLNLQGLNGLGDPVSGATDSITVTRSKPITITSVTPGSLCNTGIGELAIGGSGFVPGTTASVTLASASEEVGFDALYVKSNEAFDGVLAATMLLGDPEAGVGDPVRTVHTYINLTNQGPQGEFLTNEQTFAAPYNVDTQNYAVRFTGYIFAPSPGVRYFGVNSDDGFSLYVHGTLVGQYAEARGPATTDVTKNRTAGTMAYNFPAAGSYFMVLDFFENGGGEEIEFFQTNSSGGDRRLININAELTVFRDDVAKIDAADVQIVDENTLTCRLDVTGAEAGKWSLIVTPQCGDSTKYEPGIRIVSCLADFNSDAIVNFLDWARLAEVWGATCSAPDWCGGIDIDQNGYIDAGDAATLCDEWLAGGISSQ